MAAVAMNTDKARFNMIQQQIRPWNVLDQGVLDLLSIVKREEFVPAAHRRLARGVGELRVDPQPLGLCADRKRQAKTGVGKQFPSPRFRKQIKKRGRVA